ncbi:MAG: hypothetical protein QW186_05710 [Candidatus Bathyarchaeia archaeon]
MLYEDQRKIRYPPATSIKPCSSAFLRSEDPTLIKSWKYSRHTILRSAGDAM